MDVDITYLALTLTANVQAQQGMALRRDNKKHVNNRRSNHMAKEMSQMWVERERDITSVPASLAD